MEAAAMKWLLLLWSFSALAADAFKVQIHDRSLRVEAPAKVGEQYAVIVENLSLTDAIGKFHAGNQDLKFVNVKAGAVRSVEFRHKGKEVVKFQPMAPAFQEIELIAGKKPYEIPPKP